MATIRDVAARAGVSVATVSRVLNENGYVNKETEQRVRRAIQELNYRPNMVARGLANRKTGTIAVILPDIKNPFFSELARAVEDTARAGGFTVIFCNCDDLGPRQKSYIEVLRQKYIDGIIMASNRLEEEDVLYMNSNDIPWWCWIGGRETAIAPCSGPKTPTARNWPSGTSLMRAAERWPTSPGPRSWSPPGNG